MANQIAPWVPLLTHALSNNSSAPFTSFQFATLAESLPSVRTVVLRDFLFQDKATNVLTFNTDLRSSKMGPQEDPVKPFEACFYFPGTWEQFRIRGEWLTLSLTSCADLDSRAIALLQQYSVHHGSTHAVPTAEQLEDEVMRQWATLSRQNKSLYRRPGPGSPLTEATVALLDKIQRGVDGASNDAGLENFGIVCLCVQGVDYLNLRGGSGGERRLFQRTRERRHRIRASHDSDGEDESKSDRASESDRALDNGPGRSPDNRNRDNLKSDYLDNDNGDDIESESDIDSDSDCDEHLPMWQETDVCP